VRALGLDLGSRRIGVAVSDGDGRIATPVATIERSRDHATDHRTIVQAIAEWEAEIVAVGLPLSLDGSVGPAAQRVLEEVAELTRTLGVPVETVDERFTTVTAEQQLRASGVTGRERARVIDQVAAAILLQAWLDRRASRQETNPC
jgi:putative Holliday junction resolvase